MTLFNEFDRAFFPSPFNRLVRSFFNNETPVAAESNWRGQPFYVDLAETPNQYILKADLPGCKLADISAELIDAHLLHIKASRNYDGLGERSPNIKMIEDDRATTKCAKKEEAMVHLQERSIDELAKVEAHYENGVLEVRLKKKDVKPLSARIKKIELKSKI